MSTGALGQEEVSPGTANEPVIGADTGATVPRPRILVAEDDPAAASVLETLLRLGGYEPVVVADGDAALELLNSGPAADLLLLDWMLPGVSGVEICRAARLRWDAATLPILMVTARTDPDSITSAFAAGANDYLTKPFLGSELRARIASHLRIKRLVAERHQIDERLMEREKLSSLGVLVSSVAHDLANPLAGIMAHAQLLAEDETDADRLAAVREILGCVERCDRIVRDLLAFARRRPAERQTLDPAEVLSATLALRERHLRAIGIRVEVEIGATPLRVSGTAHQLQQVFLNLLINAEQALRSGGGYGRLKVAMRELPRAAGAARGVEIVFENDGPPIPPETLSRIFEPLFTTKRADEGTGLGLAICERIVRDHGGEILVESSEAGTSFSVRLPLVEVLPAE